MTQTVSTKKWIIIFCVLSIALALFLTTAEEANAAMNGTTGSGTITVTTKANWLVPGGESITLGNSKVSVSYQSWGKTKYKSIYPNYKIQVISTDGTHRYGTTMSTSSLKLSLKRNKTYKITVTYDGNGTWLKYCTLKNAKMRGVPYWNVKKIYKVSSCY